MARLTVLALAMAFVTATPAQAETGAEVEANAPTSNIRFPTEAPIQLERRGFTSRSSNTRTERGARQQRKGIIASKMIAPDTLIGIGLFETTPKTGGYWGDVPPNVAPRRSRRAAAIGLNWRF